MQTNIIQKKGTLQYVEKENNKGCTQKVYSSYKSKQN